jgi:hypothetical protein
MAISAATRETPLRHRGLCWVALLLGIASSFGGAYFYQQHVGHKAHAEFHALQSTRRPKSICGPARTRMFCMPSAGRMMRQRQ